MSIVNKRGGIRRALMAGIVVASGTLAIGAATTPAAQAQYYPYQYNNSYLHDYGYRHHAWWRWHQYWRWHHQYYGR